MQNNEVGDVLSSTLNDALNAVIEFFPRFLSGLIVLLIGIIIATFLKSLVERLLKFINIESWLKRYGVPEAKTGPNWSTIISELVRWFIIIIFIVPVAEIWGLTGFQRVLYGLLAYLPNVFVAVLLLLVGFVVARLVHDLVLASLSGVSKDSASTIANFARWAVIIFVVLVALNQLGIASDLIRILFSGVVAMVALAGGLSFGLGGKEAAKQLLEKYIKKL